MKGALYVGILVTFAGYTVASYGYVLIRGWNIPFRSWVSPLNPYLWPQGDPGTVPDGQIFPSQANDSTPSSAAQQVGIGGGIGSQIGTAGANTAGISGVGAQIGAGGTGISGIGSVLGANPRT